MKVKRKKILVWSLVSLTMLVIVASSGVFVFSKYNLRFADGTQFLKNGFSINPISNKEIITWANSTNRNIDVLHYRIEIELFPEEEEIVSSVLITGLTKTKDIKKIEFNFYDNFDISKVFLNNKLVAYTNEDNRLIIIRNIAANDTFYVKVEYSGTPKNLGLGSFNFDNFKGSSVIYTLNEPIYASTWFPCNDVPYDKVQMDILITNDSSKTSLSNGILTEVINRGSKKTYHWKTKYPIATYLISISSAKYVHFTDQYIYATSENAHFDTMAIDYYVFPEHLDNAKKDFDIHLDAIKFFSEKFGEYPFIKEKYGVVEFMWGLGAMENQTITGIGKNFVSGNDFFTGMLVHELAHQWWGNAVTVSGWEDIWLNEGFATYSEALYWENRAGFSALKSTMNSYLINFENTTLINPKNMFGRTTYNKGAWVLHMLRKEVGENNFFEILRKYYQAYKYKNTTTAKFIKLAEKISQKKLTQFFKQWVYEGKGNLEIEYQFENVLIDKNNFVKLRIKQVQSEFENYHFSLEMDLFNKNRIKTQKEVFINTNDTTVTFQVENPISEIIFDSDGWLAAKIQEVKD